MKKLFLLLLPLFALLKSQDGFFRFPHFLMDEADEGGSGGGSGDDESSDDSGDDDSADEDFESLPDWAKKKFGKQENEIKTLRKENGDRRTKNKGLSDRLDKFEKGLKSAFGVEEQEEVDFEKQVSSLSENLASTQFENAVISMAYENEIPKDKIGFFKYRLNEALQNLGEEDDLPEEVLAKLVQEVKGVGKGKGETGGEEHGTPPNDGNNGKGKFGKLTAEQYVKMTDSQANELFKNDRATYDRLHAEARQKRLFRAR